MKSNRLIAEFMGAEADKKTFFRTGEEVYLYHESWDWLMPVVDKCLSQSDGGWTNIYDSLLSCNIQQVYDAVVESIKEYNQN